MMIQASYLQKLSEQLVADLFESPYWENLAEAEKRSLEADIQSELDRGLLPLVPGADPALLQGLVAAARARLGIDLPASLLEVLAEVDGFSENSVALYGTDPELRQGSSDEAPGIVGQNEALWALYPALAKRYLVIGDSDLWFFALRREDEAYVALDRDTLQERHVFHDAADLVNDMLRQALREFDDDQSKENG
jgi:hypothetical protein